MLAVLLALAGLAATPGSPAWAEGADVTEHLGARVPLDLVFTSSTGAPVPLRALFDGRRPVVLVLAYSACPQLCSLVLDGTAAAVAALAARGFTDYQIATISFDPAETVAQAARRRARTQTGARPWPFLVGDEAAITALTRALGFTYLRDPRTGAFAHAAVIFVLTPDGRIARYLYGVEPPARDLKLALLEAADGAIGTTGERILMRCFRYDPASRRYGLFIARFLQIGGLLIFVLVAAGIAYLVRAERRRA